MGLEGGWEGMEWIYLAHCMDEWNVVVEKIIVHLFLQNVCNFLKTCGKN